MFIYTRNQWAAFLPLQQKQLCQGKFFYDKKSRHFPDEYTAFRLTYIP